MKRKLSILIICISLCILIASCGSNFTIVKEYSKTAPESVGLSSKQLDEITKMLKGDVAKGRIPGAVAMVFRKGEIPYLVSVGMQDKRADIPMTRDSIFRIYSMTKPIVSVAAMILCDEGRLQLDDPISKYLPEFKTMKVGVEIIGRSTAERDTFYTVPAKNPITVRDLHMHTSGLTYGVFGISAVKSMYLDAGVPDTDQTLSEKVRKISRLPLAYQPGTVWEYSRSHDVLGRLVEIVSGVTLDRFLKERIFRPLGMKNTGFYVKSGNHGRIAQTNSMIPLSDVTVPPKLLSGGGGLVSTIDDYLRFSKMLLNGGELDGKRILKKKTVMLMTKDHLGKLSERSDNKYYPGPGYGFGLGVMVRKQKEAWLPGSIGDYAWAGYAGTHFWIDPKESLIGIFMIQKPSRLGYYQSNFRKGVYGAIIDREGR